MSNWGLRLLQFLLHDLMACIEVASFPGLREKLSKVMLFWKRQGKFVSAASPFAAKRSWSSGGREELVTLRLSRVIIQQNVWQTDLPICLGWCLGKWWNRNFMRHRSYSTEQCKTSWISEIQSFILKLCVDSWDHPKLRCFKIWMACLVRISNSQQGVWETTAEGALSWFAFYPNKKDIRVFMWACWVTNKKELSLLQG